MRTEFGLERTICSCNVCRRNCEVMPGFLIPADLDRIIPAKSRDILATLAWAESNLLASPGALVMKGSQTFRIPTLVPAIKTDGSCINLTAEGQCLIHEIAPFGCAFFDCGPERNNLSHSGLNDVYKAMFGPGDRPNLYRTIWTHLAERGLTQKPAEVLRMKMRAEMEVERLRAQGWTKKDFAEALKKELE